MSTRRAMLSVAIVAGLALAGCGGQASAPDTSDQSAGGQPAASVQVRDDIPVMSDAQDTIVASEEDEYAVTYQTASPVDAVAAFYRSEMVNKGWNYDERSAAVTGAVTATLYFTKGGEECSMTATRAGDATTVVVAVVGGAALASEGEGAGAVAPGEAGQAGAGAGAAGGAAPGEGASGAAAGAPGAPAAPGQAAAGVGAVPLEVPSDIPVMADATGVVVASSEGDLTVTYSSPSAPESIAEFYRQEMPARGWGSGQDAVVVPGFNATVYFAKGSQAATVTATGLGMGGTTNVVVAVEGWTGASGLPAAAPPAGGAAAAPAPTDAAAGAPPAAPTSAPPQPSSSGSAAEDDVPIMADATNVNRTRTAGGFTIAYDSPSGVDAIKAFYESQMPAYGWAIQAGDTTHVPGVQATLYFQKAGTDVVVTITNTGGATRVQIDQQ